MAGKECDAIVKARLIYPLLSRPGRNKFRCGFQKLRRCEDQAADYDWQVKRKSMAYILFFQAGVIKTIWLYKYSERQKKAQKEKVD
jgi:hypothetical protein